MGVTVLIIFQEGQIYPQPHRIRAQFNVKRKGVKKCHFYNTI